MPKRLNFSQNWNNKLDCTFFSTIRKPEHAIFNGDICEVYLNNKKIKDVQCVHTEVLPFKDVNWATLAMDTGYLQGAVTIFKNFGIDIENGKVKILLLKTL